MQQLRRGSVGMLAAGSMVIAGLGTAGALAAEPTSANTLTGHSAWDEQAYDNDPEGGYLEPHQDDVTGPQRAPFGTSSHRMVIGGSTFQTELYRTDAYDGTLLAEITRLEYSTFARRTNGDGPLRQPTYLRLNVDNDGTDTTDSVDASLFFFPANNADQQPVANGVWQDWDVANGNISVDGDGGPGATTTLAAYVAAHPDATLVNNADGDRPGGALALINGGERGGEGDSQINGEYFVDRVIVGEGDADTLYDFGGDVETDGPVRTRVVGPMKLRGWFQQAFDWTTDAGLTSNQRFVPGPGTPPAGAGSLRFAVSDDSNPNRLEQLRTPAYDGTLLRDLRELDFSTFQKADTGNTTPQQPVYLRLTIDDDGDGTSDNSLFFYPGNNADQQPVASRTWQTWSADSGKWNVGGDTGPANAVTLDDYLVANPDAEIVNNANGTPAGGGVTFQVGAGGPAQTNGRYFLDAVRITTVDAATGRTETGTAFDLEPTHVALALEQARKHRVRALVKTVPATAGAPVRIYRITSGGKDLVLKGSLNDRGRIARVLEKKYPAGTKVKMIATVVADRMTYKSERVTIRIK